MNVAQIFRTVSEGRVVTLGGYAWSCPECGTILADSPCRERRDRNALTHCLLHDFKRFARVIVDPNDFVLQTLRITEPRYRSAHH